MKNWKKRKTENDLFWKRKSLECATSFKDKKAIARYKKEIERMESKLR